MQKGAKARTIKPYLFLPIGTMLELIEHMDIADKMCPYLFKDIVDERDVKPNKYWMSSKDFEWVDYQNLVGQELLKEVIL